jgi:hypothetical protein
MRKTLIIALTVGMTNAADAHCYSRWYYPWKQNCGVAYRSHSHSVAILQLDSASPVNTITYDIPLPDMSGIWVNSADTEEQIELNEDLERIKAIKILSNNN